MIAWESKLLRTGWILAGLALAIISVGWLIAPERSPFNLEPSSDGAALTTDARTLVLSPGNLARCWTEGYWLGHDDPLYRPVSTSSFALGNAIARSLHIPVGGTHGAINLLIHFLNAALAYKLLTHLVARRSVGLMAALLWAVHPGQLEAVVGIAGRSDLLALAFGLSACLAAQRDRLGLAAGMAALAALSKEAGCFFFAAPLLLAMGIRERDWRTLKPRAFILVGGVVFVLALQAWRHQVSAGYFVPFGDNPLVSLPSIERAAAAAHLLVTQTGRWLLNGATFFDGSFGTPEIGVFLDPASAPRARWFSLAAVALSGAGGVWLLWRWAHLGFAALWFLGAILPVSNLLFPIGTAWGDRLLYIPSLGLFALVSMALMSPRLHWKGQPTGEPTVRPVARFIALGGLAVAITLNAHLFGSRAAAWQNNDTLTIATFQHSPRSYRYLTGMAQVHLKIAQLPGQENSFGQAQAYAEEAAGTWSNSGRPLWQQDGRPAAMLAYVYDMRSAKAKGIEKHVWRQRAEEQLRRAIAIGEAKRAERQRRNDGIADGTVHLEYLNAVKSLTVLLAEQGRLEDAEITVRQAMSVAPIVPDLREGLATILAKQGKPVEARAAYLAGVVLRRKAHLLPPADRDEARRLLESMREEAEDTGYHKLIKLLAAADRDFDTQAALARP